MVACDDIDTLGLLARHGQDLNLPTIAGFAPALICLTRGAWERLAFLADQPEVNFRAKSLAGHGVKEMLEQLPMPPALKAKIRLRLGVT